MQQVPRLTASRRLLARVRDVMAGAGTPQERLDQVVGIIATDMIAEVCSIYILRAGDILELFATHGLKPEAVHKTYLNVGEGLVGDIAANAWTLTLDDAQSHPKFMYLPETGEEIYKSLMGVPILRGGRVLGVVVVQNRIQKNYDEEEVETLQTLAMVLAEMVASGELVNRDELVPTDGITVKPLRLEGVSFNNGVGMGTAVLHEQRFTIGHLVAEDPEKEKARLNKAVDEMHGALDDMFGSSDLAMGGEHQEILESYRMIAEDAGWIARIEESVNSGLTAEAAVQKVQDDIRARMRQVTDPYLKERIHDLDDLANRLLQHLLGPDADQTERDYPDNMILVARSMGPAQLLDYDYTKIQGLVLEEGTSNAHVTILAKALEIPVIGQVKNLLSRVEQDDPVIVDAVGNQLFIRPGDDLVQSFTESIEIRKQQRAAYADLKDLSAETLDGKKISLNINAGLLFDLAHIDEIGADGVGLYRSEIPFMAQQELPDVKTQQEFYSEVYELAGGKPIAFRTLDAGGDKALPYWGDAGEENPAMGWRAIRVSLDRPAFLRQQLRALIRAANGRDLTVMFPMITEVSEFKAARKLLDAELKREIKRSRPTPATVKVGAMLEVPALYFQLPALLDQVDFLSVGSNDLFQFIFASDRGNPRLTDRYDLLSPPVLSILHSIVEQANSAGIPVSLCGEMASKPLEAMALIGIGFQNLSMAPPSLGPVKSMVRSLNAGPLIEFMDSIYGHSDRTIRENLRAFARDHGVMI